MVISKNTRRSIWIAAICFLVGATIMLSLYLEPTTSVRPNKAFIEKLESARHFKSQKPAQRQTIDLAMKSSLKLAALNAIGMEQREVGGMAKGSPDLVFAMLSHLGGFGEVIWVDDWTNFPIKLPPTSIPGQVVVPRRDAVRAALDSIAASGGCLIKAGENRFLVAKVSEKKQYEAAIRSLGWLDGTSPPWDKTNGTSL
jgi:hypothetical protein